MKTVNGNGSRYQYSPEFKAQIVQQMLRDNKSIEDLAAEHNVHKDQLNQWRDIALKGLPSLFLDTVQLNFLTRCFITLTAVLFVVTHWLQQRDYPVDNTILILFGIAIFPWVIHIFSKFKALGIEVEMDRKIKEVEVKIGRKIEIESRKI